MYLKAQITRLLLDHFADDNRRIEHALEVLCEAEQLLNEPGYADCDPEIVIAASLLHDVGIKPSEAELGYNNGKTQEKYGPPIAGRLLESIYFPPAKTTVVKEIIGNHHSPSRYDYPELELLKKADRIVNLKDEKHRREQSSRP
jgi:HD superfamily phosphodiesterase